MKNKYIIEFICFSFLLIYGFNYANAQSDTSQTLDRGKYLVITNGCNDCHTPGYIESEGKTLEKHWLTGVAFGWRGPWGTTYATNLRISIQSFTEDQWVKYTKNLKTRPPMPWYNLNKTNEKDLRAIYKYIKHLGPAGEPAPGYLPPDKEPKTPYALFP